MSEHDTAQLTAVPCRKPVAVAIVRIDWECPVDEMGDTLRRALDVLREAGPAEADVRTAKRAPR